MTVMPNRMRVAAVVSALILAAGLLTLALMAQPAQAQPGNGTVNQKYTDIRRVFVCTEKVDFEGTTHLLGHFTIDPTGGWHIVFHVNLKGTGEGLRSGDEYIYNEAWTDSIYLPEFTEGREVTTFAQSVMIIRRGSHTPADDLQAKALGHFTVNAQGEVIAEVAKFKFACK